MYFRCKCVNKMQITEEPAVTVLERYGVHLPDGSKEDHSKYLKRGQINAIKEMVRGNPLIAPSAVRRNLKNFDESSHVSTELSPSVKRLVSKERREDRKSTRLNSSH